MRRQRAAGGTVRRRHGSDGRCAAPGHYRRSRVIPCRWADPIVGGGRTRDTRRTHGRAGRAVGTRTSGSVGAGAARSVRAGARRDGGTGRAVGPDRAPGGGLDARARSGGTVGATADVARRRRVAGGRSGPARTGGATRRRTPGGGTAGRRGSATPGGETGKRVVAVASRGGSSRTGRTVGAGLGRGAAASDGRIGRRGAPSGDGAFAGARRVGQAAARLLAGGVRRVGSGRSTAGGCARARVRRRSGGPAAGPFGGRVGHGEPAGRTVGQIARGWHGTVRGGLPTGRRAWCTAAAVDHRQAGVGVWQAAGLTQPVGRSLRAIRPGLAAAGLRTPFLLVRDGTATPGRADDWRTAGGRAAGGRATSRRTAGGRDAGGRGAVGRAAGGWGAGTVGHRRGVAGPGHDRRGGFGGAASSGGGGSGGGPGASRVGRTGVGRARSPPGGPGVGVDGRIGAQSVGDRHGGGRRGVEPGRAASGGRPGGARWVGRRTGHPTSAAGPRTGRTTSGAGRTTGAASRRTGRTTSGGPVSGGRRAAGLGGLRARTTRRPGVGSAQRWHGVRGTGRGGGGRAAADRRAGHRRTGGRTGRDRTRARPNLPSRTTGRRARAGRSRLFTGDGTGRGGRGGGAGTGWRRHAAPGRLTGSGRTGGRRAVDGRAVVRAAGRRRGLARPRAVHGTPRGAVRVAPAYAGRGGRCRDPTARAGGLRGGALGAEFRTLLLGRAEVVDPAELLTRHRLLRLGLGSASTPAAALGPGIAPLVRALVRAVPTTRFHY